MPIINPRLRFIERFLAHFNSVFSKNHQKSVFKQFIYGMFTDYKCLSLAAIANNTAMNYQQLQYFFSESNWSIQKLNDIRVRLLQNQRTTKANSKGVLAIDNTACPKPHAQKTEGAQMQYCGCLGKEENANDAVNKKVPFSSVVVDAWYTSTDLIELVASNNLTLAAEVKINRSIFFTHPQTKQWRYLTGDKIIPLIKEFYPHKLKNNCHTTGRRDR